MFWRRKTPDDRSLVPHRNRLNALALNLLHAANVDFDNGSDLQRALVGTFFFGMLYSHGRAGELAPADIHALALAVYQDSLHYTPEAATQAVQNCIDATRPG